jgi:hypothetical protein
MLSSLFHVEHLQELWATDVWIDRGDQEAASEINRSNRAREAALIS